MLALAVTAMGTLVDVIAAVVIVAVPYTVAGIAGSARAFSRARDRGRG